MHGEKAELSMNPDQKANRKNHSLHQRTDGLHNIRIYILFLVVIAILVGVCIHINTHIYLSSRVIHRLLVIHTHRTMYIPVPALISMPLRLR